MMFKENSALYSTEVERKQGEDTLYVNFLGAPFVPSLSDRPDVRMRVIEFLSDNPGISKIVFFAKKLPLSLRTSKSFGRNSSGL